MISYGLHGLVRQIPKVTSKSGPKKKQKRPTFSTSQASDIQYKLIKV